MAMDYKKAGVDIEAGYRSVELIKKHVASTMRSEVLGGIGGFSGAFSAAGMKDMSSRRHSSAEAGWDRPASAAICSSVRGM